MLIVGKTLLEENRRPYTYVNELANVLREQQMIEHTNKFDRELRGLVEMEIYLFADRYKYT